MYIVAQQSGSSVLYSFDLSIPDSRPRLHCSATLPTAGCSALTHCAFRNLFKSHTIDNIDDPSPQM